MDAQLLCLRHITLNLILFYLVCMISLDACKRSFFIGAQLCHLVQFIHGVIITLRILILRLLIIVILISLRTFVIFILHFIVHLQLMLLCFHFLLVYECIIYTVIKVCIIIALVLSIEVSALLAEFDDLRFLWLQLTNDLLWPVKQLRMVLIKTALGRVEWCVYYRLFRNVLFDLDFIDYQWHALLFVWLNIESLEFKRGGRFLVQISLIFFEEVLKLLLFLFSQLILILQVIFFSVQIVFSEDEVAVSDYSRVLRNLNNSVGLVLFLFFYLTYCFILLLESLLLYLGKSMEIILPYELLFLISEYYIGEIRPICVDRLLPVLRFQKPWMIQCFL